MLFPFNRDKDAAAETGTAGVDPLQPVRQPTARRREQVAEWRVLTSSNGEAEIDGDPMNHRLAERVSQKWRNLAYKRTGPVERRMEAPRLRGPMVRPNRERRASNGSHCAKLWAGRKLGLMCGRKSA